MDLLKYIVRYILAKRFLVILSLIVFFAICSVMHFSSRINPNNNQDLLSRIEHFIKSDERNNMVCKQPVLPVNTPEMMSFINDVPKFNCLEKSNPDWVVCKKSECFIKESIKNAKGNIKCKFTNVIRENDHKIKESSTVVLTDDKYQLVDSDIVKIKCTSEFGDDWSSIKTGLRLEKTIWDRSGWQHLPKDSLKLNVLMFGLDSLSRNMFIRKLPKTYRYLTDELGANVLQGYNIVGDGTPQALTPILTGKTELELPDVRNRYYGTKPVDVYPMVWKDYKANGYVTGYFEDLPESGVYTYRLNGFDKQPTDHYMRTYYVASGSYYRHWPKYCDGDTPRHKVMLNHIVDFFNFYKSKPKFLFAFHGELSHNDYNLVGAADDDILDALETLHRSGALDNTVLIVMADHGHRFAKVRNTVQGKLEERLPFFSFRFPPSFKVAHKNLYDNFISNLNTLTTPFDIHETLMDILHGNSEDVGSLRKRSNSLLSKIPKERSCADAFIEPHWCACLDWEPFEVTDPIVKRLTKVFLSKLNGYTEEHRDMCAELNLSEVDSVARLKPNSHLLKFKFAADLDGFVPDMSGKTVVDTVNYQIKLKTSPGNGLFEATITHKVKSDEFDMKLTDVSRANLYGEQARCVVDDYPHLRKYCYCTTR